jgi:hypothetical protein
MLSFFSSVKKLFNNKQNKVNPDGKPAPIKSSFRALSSKAQTLEYMQWNLTAGNEVPFEARLWMELNFMLAKEQQAKCSRPLKPSFLHGQQLEELSIYQWLDHADYLMDELLKDLNLQQQQFEDWLLAEGKEAEPWKSCGRWMHRQQQEPKMVICRKKRQQKKEKRTN